MEPACCPGWLLVVYRDAVGGAEVLDLDGMHAHGQTSVPTGQTRVVQGDIGFGTSANDMLATVQRHNPATIGSCDDFE